MPAVDGELVTSVADEVIAESGRCLAVQWLGLTAVPPFLLPKVPTLNPTIRA